MIREVEVVSGEAAYELMKALHPEALEATGKGVEDDVPSTEAAKDGAAVPEAPSLDIVDGLRVNKAGEV